MAQVKGTPVVDSRQLAQFKQIVLSGSMSAAARALGIAQPSLSQLVRNLEGAVGVELLVRSARGVTVTEAGALLYSYACEIERLLRAAREDIANVGSKPSGQVLFGMPPSIAMALSTPMAETLRNDMPDVRFCATEAMSGYLRDWVMAGEIDLAILYDRSNLGECTAEALLTEELWFFSAVDDWPFDTPAGAPVYLEAAARQDLALPTARHGLRTFIDRAARNERLDLRVSIETDSLTQIKSLVARGSGYTILSPASMHDLVADGVLVGSPIHSPLLRRTLFLVRSGKKPVSAAQRATEVCCREVIRDLVKRGIWQAELPEET